MEVTLSMRIEVYFDIFLCYFHFSKYRYAQVRGYSRAKDHIKVYMEDLKRN